MNDTNKQIVREALCECLGHITGGMDGTWSHHKDAAGMARKALEALDSQNGGEWKPVKQTQTGHRGNCMSACLSSLLNIPLENVPNFYEISEDDAGWWRELRKWLSTQGFGVITIQYLPDIVEALEGKVIVAGETVRGTYHATIWENGKMIHDPHPSGKGIKSPERIDLLYPLFKKLAQKKDTATKIYDEFIDQCESELSDAEHRKKVAAADYHTSEINHQDGRWHCANDLREYAENLKKLNVQQNKS